MEKVTNDDTGGGESKIWHFSVTSFLNGPKQKLSNTLRLSFIFLKTICFCHPHFYHFNEIKKVNEKRITHIRDS